MATTTETETPPVAPAEGEVVDPAAIEAEAAAVLHDTGITRATARTGGDLVPSRKATLATAFAGVIPASIGEVVMLARHLAMSDVVPRSLQRKPDTVLTVILAGMEMGLTPVRALNSISIISGNMAMKADLQLALARASGQLTFHREGFETKGKTDSKLAERIKNFVKLAKIEDLEGQIIADELLAAVGDLEAGKPYGWCIVRRSQEPLKLRTFTWADADRVTIRSKRNDDEVEETTAADGTKRKTLAGKGLYADWPQQIYPRRARGHLLQIEFGDVLLNMQPAENLDEGQIVNAEVVHSSGPRTADTADTMLADITGANADLAEKIRAAFAELQVAPAKQLQLLTQYKAKPEELYAWCRDEFARRRGADAAPPKGSGTGKKKAAGKDKATTKPVQAASHPDGPAKPAAATKVEPPKPEPPAEPTVADRMKAAVTKTTKSGSF